MLRYGMIGGDLQSFIGGVHRTALRMDPGVELVCGCFSRNEEKNRDCGDMYDVSRDRIYTDWREMLRVECAREDKIDFVAVCTPNHLHYEVCREFLLAGINVVCEKPLCFEIAEAEELDRLAKERDLVFGVLYTYVGYNMVKVMREMIARGDIGEIVAIHGRYAQNWLLDELSNTDVSNEKVWRTEPEFSGISNSIGDIGTHLEYIIHYVTGLNIKRLCATVDCYGKKLDYNDSILVEYENGVHGCYWVSQVAAGQINGLKFGIYGTEGSLEWEQHYPDYAVYTRRGQAPQTICRGAGYLNVNANANIRIPTGHPEGFYCAFANIYRNIVRTIEKKKNGEIPTENDLDFPTSEAGVEGVKFIHAVIESGRKDSQWVYMD